MDSIIQIVESWKHDINEMNNQIVSPNPKSFSELKKKKKLMTPDEDMARVNPYIGYSDDFKINCSYCTAAYDLRRRGYDVEADSYDTGADIFEIYSWWTHTLSRISVPFNTAIRQAYLDILYPGYKYFLMDEFTLQEIKDSLIYYGGSRGQISFMWKAGNAHSVIYEINYGKLILRDCQHNQKIEFEEFAKKASRIYYFRTDNEEPTNKILNYIKNKKSDIVYFSDKNSMDTLIKRLKNAGYKASYYKKKVRVDLKDHYLLINNDGKIEVQNILNEVYDEKFN